MDFNKLKNICGLDSKLDYIYQSLDNDCTDGNFDLVESDLNEFLNGDFSAEELLGVLVITRVWKTALPTREKVYKRITELYDNPRIYAGLE